ncbi:MAG: biopolymer transporter ExbD [Candidatus Azobacteroides sp.]|nr:biopolymer transporter ExbD [Candidatus Azobacteroides sp.]
MSRFRKNDRRKVPSLNTAALPDLIFTLLFFFLLTVNMRTVPTLTQVQLPNASELQKLKEKSLLVYLSVGKSSDENQKNPYEIQLNSELIALEDILFKLQAMKEAMKPEEQNQSVVLLKINKDTPMGLVNDIRRDLREAQLQTVYYTVEKSR